MVNPPNPRRGRSHNLSAGASGQGASGHNAGAGHRGSRPSGKFNKDLLYCLTPATDVGKEDTKRHRTARLWTLHAEGVERKDIMRRFA